MNRSQPFVVVVLLIGLFLIGSSVYTVSEVNQAIITQFGEPVGEPVIEPGLHFKLPFIQRANMFEKRFLEWDGFPNQVPTRDRRFIWVDTYARWRITDPLLFFQRLRDERGAQSRLDDILDGETRNAVARHDLIEIVRSTNREPVNSNRTGDEEAEVLLGTEGEPFSFEADAGVDVAFCCLSAAKGTGVPRVEAFVRRVAP